MHCIDVAYCKIGHVAWSVGLCWAHWWAMQKLLNRSTCCLGVWLAWARGTVYSKGHFLELAGPLKSIGSLHYGVCSKRNHLSIMACSVRDHSILHDGTWCGLSSKFVDHLSSMLLCVVCSCFHLPFLRPVISSTHHTLRPALPHLAT